MASALQLLSLKGSLGPSFPCFFGRVSRCLEALITALEVEEENLDVPVQNQIPDAKWERLSR